MSALYNDDNPMEGPLVADTILDLIGRTPCVRVNKLNVEAGCKANIILKLESMEPCSSVKDRLAKAMVMGAEERGEITPGETVLVEPTSGNTGIGLAMVAAARGYKCIIVMPHTMSTERRVMLKALGAELVLTPGENGIKGVFLKADEIVKSLNGKGRCLQQFSNPDNVEVHMKTTGPEIWHQTQGTVDALVAGVGTGGTISGTGKFLKSKKPSVQVYGVEPEESAVISGNEPGAHKIQGIGAGFVPDNYLREVIDEVVPIHSDLAISTSRALAVEEGIFVGISAGAAVAAALKIGARDEMAGKNIVVIIASFGERYVISED